MSKAKTQKTESHYSLHYCPYCGRDGITCRGFSGVRTIYRCDECRKRFVVKRDKEELGNQ